MNRQAKRNFSLENFVLVFRSLALVLVIGMACLVLFVPHVLAQTPCCTITAVDQHTGVVGAKVNATAQVFEFRPTNPALLQSLKIGEAIYANFTTRQVSVDGKTPCGAIVSVGSTKGSLAPAPPSRAPSRPPAPPSGMPTNPPGGTTRPIAPPGKIAACCGIISIDASQNLASAKENSTGRTFQFKANNPAAMGSLKPGEGIYANFGKMQVSLDGLNVFGTIISLGQLGINSVTKQLTGATFQPIGFQLCCHLTQEGSAFNNYVYYATVDTGQYFTAAGNQNWAIGVQPLQPSSLPLSTSSGGVPIPPYIPLYANFGTRQVSLDGKTAWGKITSGTPVTQTLTVYLDVLPVTIIYSPPGDPQATSATQSYQLPKQSFTSSTSTATQSTVTNVSSQGWSVKLDASYDGVGINADLGDTTTTNSVNTLGASQGSQAGLTAFGPSYAGANDLIVFNVNPTYDVTSVTAFAYGQNLPTIPLTTPQVTSVVKHSLATYDQVQSQWELCAATVQQFRTQNLPVCARDVLPAPPVSASSAPASKAAAPRLAMAPGGGSGDPTTLSVLKWMMSLPLWQQRLLMLDPMIYADYAYSVVVNDTSHRFQPLSLFGSNSVAWSYCGGSVSFGAGVGQTDTRSSQTTNRFTAGVTLSVSKSGGGSSGSPGYAGGGGVGYQWEFDSTTGYQTSNQTQLNTSGNFGGGTQTPCPPTGYRTFPYYDWLSNTVLFPTVADNPSQQSGAAAPVSRR